KRGGARETEPDPPGLAAAGAARCGDSMLDPIQDRPCFSEERLARLGQLDTARFAPEELYLEFGFERADLLAQRRLLNAQPLRRASDMALLGDGDEIAKVPQFHYDTRNVWIEALSYIGHRVTIRLDLPK